MKTILITGANGHLGTAVTRHFLDKGYRVVAVVLDPAHAPATASEHLDTLAADLKNEEAAAEMVRTTIEKYGGIDAALLLAGGFTAGGIANTSGSDIQQQIELNFNTAYFVARPVFAQMQKQGRGKIVFVGARPALQPSSGKDLVAYSLSKSMLFRIAEYINEEARGTDIAATVIAPSTIDTPANRAAMPDADSSKWVPPASIAEILEFIVSDKSAALRETVLKVYNNV